MLKPLFINTGDLQNPNTLLNSLHPSIRYKPTSFKKQKIQKTCVNLMNYKEYFYHDPEHESYRGCNDAQEASACKEF